MTEAGPQPQNESPDPKPMSKRDILWAVCMCMSVCMEQMLYAVIAPFLPVVVSTALSDICLILTYFFRLHQRTCHHHKQGSFLEPIPLANLL